MRESFIFRRKLHHLQLAEWVQRQLCIVLQIHDPMWILYAESWGGQDISTGVGGVLSSYEIHCDLVRTYCCYSGAESQM